MNNKGFFIKISDTVKLFDDMKNEYSGGVIPVVHRNIPKAQAQGQMPQYGGYGQMEMQTLQGFINTVDFSVPVRVYKSIEKMQKDPSEAFAPRISKAEPAIREIKIESGDFNPYSDVELKAATIAAFEKVFGAGKIEVLDVAEV